MNIRRFARFRPGFWSSVSIALLVAGCAEEPLAPNEPERNEGIGSVEQPINEGTTDVLDTYTVRLTFDDQVNPDKEKHCSGVLVTPRWVLTANHCITGASTDGFHDSNGGGVSGDYEITVVPAGESSSSAGSAQTFWHTNAVSGDVIVNKTTKMELGPFDDNDDVVRDFVLMKIDSRVPGWLAKPLHVPLLGTQKCPQDDDFDGHIVGFGAKAFEADLSPTGGGVRRSGDDGDYFRKESGYADYYDSFWTSPFKMFPDPIGGLISLTGAFGSYRGIMAADSGGPLVYLADDGPRLCGVASTTTMRPRCSMMCGCNFVFDPVPCAALFNKHAAADSDLALAIFDNHLVTTDIHGEQVFDGECSADPDSDADADGDNLVDACDRCPYDADESNVDSDHDGDGDACDSCPLTWNPVQADSDNDGRGNACDPCPSDYGSASEGYGDADHDGVCNHKDNCANVPNATQRNTNTLSESVHTPGLRWGDACEPVPQPRSAVLSKSEKLYDVQNQWMDSAVYAVTEDTIAVWPQPSRRAPAGSPELASVNVPKVPTHFRFCQHGPHDTAPLCNAPESIDDAQLHLGLDAAFETADMPYRQVTLDFGDGTTPRGTSVTLDYANAFFRFPALTARWDFNADAAFWLSEGTLTFPEGTPEEPGAGLSGVFWLHASTEVGNSDDVGTGLHGEGLANAHLGIDVHYLTGHSWMKWPEEYWWGFDRKWLPRWPDFKELFVGQEQRVLTPRAEGALSLFSKTAQRLLADGSFHWLGAVEPEAAVGDGPVAVALSEDDTQIAEALFADPKSQHLVTGGELGVAIEEAPFRSTGPDRVTHSFYSRALRSVFAFGASRAGGSVWRSTSATTRGWLELPLSAPLGNVLAATASFVDRKLYVFDEISGKDGALVGRLVQIDPERGTLSVITSAPRQGNYERIGITLDREGELILSGTSAARQAHFVVRVGVGGPKAVALGKYSGKGDLAHPPFVTEDGYTLFTVSRKTERAETLPSLDQTRASLRDIGALL